MAEAISLDDALLIARDQPVQPWHAVTVLILDGPIARAELALLIAQRIAYAPRFRQRLGGFGVGQFWVDDPGLRIPGHIRETALQPGESLDAWLATQLAAPIERLHPLWDATLVDGVGDGRVALVVRVHPALVDGVDNVHLLQELLDSEPTPINGDAPDWNPPREDATPGLGGLLGSLSDPIRALRDAAAGLTSLAETGVRQATAVARERFVAAVSVPLSEVRAARDAAGCTTHDVLLALATAGARGWLLDNGRSLDDPVALVPLAVADPDGVSAVSCAVVPQFISLPVSAPTTAERLGSITTLTQARVDSERLLPAGELVEIAGFAAPTLHTLAARQVLAGRPHQVLVANVPGPVGPRFLGERRVLAVYGFDSTVDEQELSIGITSYGPTVTFAATAVADLPGFAAQVGDELGRLSRRPR